jgi:beta-glucosidase
LIGASFEYRVIFSRMRTKKSGFLWGAATSAYQVEGGNIHSDWWNWEKKSSDRVMSGRATNHYELFEDDFKLARDLGHNAHRFSIEWARIEPTEGEWSDEAIEHYRDVLLALKKQGLEPLVTLHHFTLPQWVAREGGWQNPKTVYWFNRYVEKIVGSLNDLADFWVTVNEPMVYTDQAYWKGNWPPQARHNFRVAWRVTRHLIRAHKEAYRVIHKLQPRARVGVAKHFISFWPETNSEIYV